MKLTKLLTSLLACTALTAYAAGTPIAVPKRAGPVSYYGALHTSGNKIVGAKNNQQAMLRGVSLFWSDATGMPYYNPTVISWAVDNLKIDVFRYALGIEYYDSDGGTKNKIDEQSSYKDQSQLIEKMVKAAIENDVYIIIDWHSHRAHLETNKAKDFFKTISEKYKDVPNIIYEIYNEPVDGSGGNWSAVKSYANTICPVIRANTQNLIIVGTPSWSQNPQNGASDPVNSTNIAYVLHFYAATHPKGSYGGRIDQALNAGYPVFISEWGTTNADGNGDPNSSATSEWTSYMDQKQIPNCNWSLRQQTSDVDQKSEKSAIFAGEKPLITAAALDAATYTTSGNIIKSYLTKNARSWADSLVKGKNTGSCAFKATTAKQTDGKISGVLKSGCTYTSSNENVASASGSDIVVNDYGIAILTGNDGSQSIVTVKQVAGQTILNLENMTCYFTGTCKTDTKTGRTVDFETTGGTGDKDYVLTMDDKTLEGAKFTLTALDPTIVSVSKSTCKNSACTGTNKNEQVWMLHFKGYGTGRIVASAPAVASFRAMQDTFEITYKKGNDQMTSAFKNMTVALGASVAKGFPATSLNGKAPVTYTFNGKETTPYLTLQSPSLTAGNQNAIVAITATGPETDNFYALKQTITVIIGDSASAVNMKEYQEFLNPFASIKPVRKIANNLQANMNGTMLHFTTKNTGLVNIDIYDALGASVMQKSDIYSAGSHAVDLKNLPNGSYTLVVRQGNHKASIRWINK